MLEAFLYDVLEVSPNARASVIKAAYRCLVQEYHPDKNPGDAEAAARMSLINHAYSVLGDSLQRARYDEKMRLRAVERRGSGASANAMKPAAGKSGKGLRPFAFRPLS